MSSYLYINNYADVWYHEYVMEKFSKIEGREVPQLNPKTGVSHDYSNEINSIVGFLTNIGMDSVKKALKEFPFHMRKYEDVYSDYNNVVNDKNREAVQRLNELASQMNEILKDPNYIDEAAFKKVANEIYFIIKGDDSIKI